MTKNNSNWKTIEEEYTKEFNSFALKEMMLGKMVTWQDCTVWSLAFFKPYFQEQMHTEAVEELE